MIREHVIKLTNKEKKDCLNNWNDKKSKDLIFRANIPLALHIAKKFYDTNIEPEELQQLAIIGLWKGINSYKVEKKVAVSTYCGRCINNEILNHIKKENDRLKLIESNLSEVIGTNDGHEITIEDSIFDECNHYEKIEEVDYIEYLFKGLKDVELDIITKMYLHDIPQKKIVEEYGCSQSNIARKVMSAKSKIKQKLVAIM